jgi:energy-coupling factor transporter ATP-binding protein EcfA2
MTRYALVVGIADYDSLPSLTKPTRDAEAVAQRLEKHGDFKVERFPKRWNPDKDCYEVAQERLTGKQLGQALREFLQKQARGSDALIYFGGHGITIKDELGQQKGYLAASDCTIVMEGKQIVGQQHGVALDSLNCLISEADLKSLVVLLDCCHAEYFLESHSIRQILSAFTYKPDCHLIAACRNFEFTYQGGRYGWGHSAFTTVLLEGLLPENAGSDGQVRVDELFAFISRKPEDKELRRDRGDSEYPIWMGSGNSLTLVSYPPKHTPRKAGVTCPYQGLLPFDRPSARFFFGRKPVIQNLRQKLEEGNFVLAIGAAGSGKSSAVQAGLIPLLEASSWRVLEPIVPGSEPVAQLKRALAALVQALHARELDELIDSAPDLQPVIQLLPGSERVLLVVDQFEEVFAVCSQPADRHRFIQLLTRISQIPSRRLATVILLRADFLEPCLDYPLLTALIQERAVYIPPLVGDSLQQAIACPAALSGFPLETGLLEAILEDVSQEKSGLSKLQFALTQLWHQRDRHTRQLTLALYRQLGGVSSALNRHAEQLYSSLKPQQQDWVKQIFLQLVREGTGCHDMPQRQPKSQLLAIAGESPDQRLALSDSLDRLVAEGLLATGESATGEVWVELAGVALMDGWERFAQWRQEYRCQRLCGGAGEVVAAPE